MLMKFMEILVSLGGSQGASLQGGSSSARSFDLARPRVAPPLIKHDIILLLTCNIV